MSPFSLDEVRAVAEQFGYTEIGRNEISRVVSFCKESVRINVYYTTRTVGTCLNHPARGKTQLFRREVSMDQLAQIFDNPRSHTGKRYYSRQNLRQQWRDADGSDTSDMARRWLYVCAAAGLSSKQTHFDVLKRLMNKITAILWEPGQFPDTTNTRMGCGSHSALENVVLQVAAHDGGIGHTSSNDEEAGEVKRQPSCSTCVNFDAFHRDEGNRADIKLVKSLLMQLPRKLRMQICDWLVGLLLCSHYLVDSEDGHRFVDTEVCLQAHWDYSKLAYPKKELNKICMAHGDYDE